MTGEPGVLVYCCESAEFREYSPLFALMLCDQLALAAFTKYNNTVYTIVCIEHNISNYLKLQNV